MTSIKSLWAFNTTRHTGFNNTGHPFGMRYTNFSETSELTKNRLIATIAVVRNPEWTVEKRNPGVVVSDGAFPCKILQQ